MDKALAYWRQLPREGRLTLAVMVFGGLLLLYFLLSPLFRLWAENRATIDSTEPRVGRMLGFEASGEELARSLERSKSLLALYTYDPGQDLSGLMALLQQLVRELAEDSGLQVAGSQPIDGEGSEGIDAVAVNVELRGGVEALEVFLQELTTATPILHLESMRINVPRQRGGNTPAKQAISASVRVSAFRVQGA